MKFTIRFLTFLFHIALVSKVLANCPIKCSCLLNSITCVWKNLHYVPGNLSFNITILDLQYNKIETLTNAFPTNFPYLDTVHLHQNKIRSIEPGTFESVSQLKQLYLNHNNLSFLENNVFSGLSNLIRLNLHNNNLKIISANAFPELPFIELLSLNGNPLHCNNCELFWFVDFLLNSNRNRDVQITGVCTEPASLHDKPLNYLGVATETQGCRYPIVKISSNLIKAQSKESVFIKCEVNGYRRPHVAWKKNGEYLDLKDERYKQFSNGLKIQFVTYTDEGIYECLATGEAGLAKSEPITLKLKSEDSSNQVSFLGKSFSRNFTGKVFPNLLISKEGDNAQIDCFVNDEPVLPILWFRNNLMVEETQKITLLKNGSLIFKSTQLDDSGKYDCVTREPSTFVLGSAELIVHAKPKIVSFSKSFSIGVGSNIELQCIAIGQPKPIITWFKNGTSVIPSSGIKLQQEQNVLRIENARENDSGMYTCVAQNAVGVIEHSSEIRVKNKGSRMPRIIIKPFDIEVPEFSSIEIPCKTDAEPAAKIRWLKNNELLNIDYPKIRVSNVNSLRIYNVSLKDSGLYTCIASNIYGNDTASGRVAIGKFSLGKEDNYIVNAYQDAKLEVDRAINATINLLFVQHNISNQSPEFLMRIFRYPDEFSRNFVKSAEIYSRTLFNVRKHLTSGLKLNLTDDFIHKEILSETQLELIANLSGCVPHQYVTNCSNIQFHSKYATIDGTCNNLQHPMWGSSYSPFRRLLKPIYENGFSTPVGWNRDRRYHGFGKPHARLVTTALIRTSTITEDPEITHMVMQWGQFLDHDLDHALPSTSAESWEGGLDCKKTCAYSEPCFPMEVPHDDSRIKSRRCMDFIRSSAVCGTGDTSIFFNHLHPREQLNQLTSYIDASMVYGFGRDRSFLLRELTTDLGLLRSGILSERSKAYLPLAGTNEVDCRRDLGESNIGCFLAGDIRVNEQVGLIAIQTMMVREHNRLATELKKINPSWNGDTLYYEARRILIAEIQHITYAHWLRRLIGIDGMTKLGHYQGYNSNIDVSISNVFATAAFRIGHTLIRPELRRVDGDFKTISQGNLPLGKAFFAPWRLVEEGGVDPLMRGFIVDPAKLKTPDQNLNDQLTDHLFTVAHAVSLDLAAMNIQRSRDHGLPGYLAYRRYCNLSAPDTFEYLDDINSLDIKKKLEELYGHPDNIDVWVGGILEDQLKGAKVGPLFRCLLVEQFSRLRAGDRFWYENPTVFTSSQLKQIKNFSLARLLCNNGDNITQVTRDVFILPHIQEPNFVSCSDVPDIDLQKWRNCGAGCKNELIKP